ncbi:hypothetical protein C7S18_09365 [Ahniella affigens]|uniref:Uncharacterized protein n=1 Tax=Ahniella affigens TaxID=2021234 RepID=A0A2P1PRB6_9GAMM|nr:hypothetical protein C7S18_09365 [Ahniella affigens]
MRPTRFGTHGANGQPFARAGVIKSILDFQTRNESGTCPVSLLQNQALACPILDGPSMARIASELVQMLPRLKLTPD